MSASATPLADGILTPNEEDGLFEEEGDDANQQVMAVIREADTALEANRTCHAYRDKLLPAILPFREPCAYFRLLKTTINTSFKRYTNAAAGSNFHSSLCKLVLYCRSTTALADAQLVHTLQTLRGNGGRLVSDSSISLLSRQILPRLQVLSEVYNKQYLQIDQIETVKSVPDDSHLDQLLHAVFLLCERLKPPNNDRGHRALAPLAVELLIVMGLEQKLPARCVSIAMSHLESNHDLFLSSHVRTQIVAWCETSLASVSQLPDTDPGKWLAHQAALTCLAEFMRVYTSTITRTHAAAVLDKALSIAQYLAKQVPPTRVSATIP